MVKGDLIDEFFNNLPFANIIEKQQHQHEFFGTSHSIRLLEFQEEKYSQEIAL